MEPIVPKIEQAPRAIQKIRAEDLQVLSYEQVPGGMLGRMTKIRTKHPELGESEMVFPIPMTEEAALQWIELTIPARLYRQGMDASFSDVKQEKPEGVWTGDPLKGLSHEEKQAVIQDLRLKAGSQ